MAETLKSPLRLWLVTDGKPGHRNQLAALADRIAERTEVDLRWIGCDEFQSGWWDLLLKRWPESAIDKPDLAISAGHRTHRLLWHIGRAFGCLTAVLMKPSLPLACFDLAIIPEHDRPPVNGKVLSVTGAINGVQPRPLSQTLQRGLILLGGESAHYQWQDGEIARQVNQLVSSNPEVQWLLSDSRRTPPSCLLGIDCKLTNLEAIHHTDTPMGWVAKQIGRADTIWTTPDSVSMVYEAISSGQKVGLFTLPILKPGRVNRGIEALREQQRVMDPGADIAAWLPKMEPLNEASRAASWLLDKLAQR